MSRFADIGAAVIGTGFIGTVHVEAAPPDRRRRPRRPRQHRRSAARPGPRPSASATPTPRSTSILADPAVDVVHVTSPNHLHVPQASAILAAGKHVVCEKPLAMTAAESAGLVARRRGERPRQRGQLQHPLLPAPPARARGRSPPASSARSGFVTGHYFQDWLLHDTDWNWRLEPDQGGALRAVGDIGSHWLDLMAFVTGQPIVSVMADLATFVDDPPASRPARSRRSRPSDPRDTVDAADGHRGHGDDPPPLRQRRPRRGGRLADQRRPEELAPVGDRRLRRRGWPGTRETPDQLWLGHRDRPNEILLRNPALMGAAGRAAAALPGGHVEGFGDTFGALFRAIYADVAGRAAVRHDPPYADFADGHDEMLVNDAIARERPRAAAGSTSIARRRPGAAPSRPRPPWRTRA